MITADLVELDATQCQLAETEIPSAYNHRCCDCSCDSCHYSQSAMIKQIAMMVMLGPLLTVGALMTIYPQHASADTTTNPNRNGRNYDNGYFGGGIASNPNGQKGQNASPDDGTNAFNDNHLNHPNYTTG